MRIPNFFIFISIFFCHNLIAQPFLEIQKWVSIQDGKLHSYDVTESIETSKAWDKISYSDEYIFSPPIPGYMSSTALGPDKFIVAFHDSIPQGNLVLGRIVGDTVVFSQKYIFHNDYAGFFSVIGMDSNRFVVSWCDWYGPGGGAHRIKSRVGTVIDTVVNFGSVTEWGNGNNRISTAKLDSTHFILVNKGEAFLCSVSGNIVSFEAVQAFNSDAHAYYVAALDNNRFVVVYNSGGYFYTPGKAIVGTVNGGSMTFGNEYIFCTDTAAYFRVTNLDTNSFVITYPHHTSGGDMGTACIGITHGDSISFGNKFSFGRVTNYFFYPLRLDADHFLTTSSSFYDSIPHGDSHIGSVWGDSVSFSPSYWFNSDYCSSISSDMLDENRFFIAYRESYSTSDKGGVVIGSYYGQIKTLIDSLVVCSGSILIPVRVKYLFEATESYLQLEYDTSMFSYIGYRNFTSNIPIDSVSITENDGLIDVFWHSTSPTNIESDTLVEFLFNTTDIYTQSTTTITFNDTISYYANGIGTMFDTEFISGSITIDPIPEPLIFITAPDSVCQGSQNVFYCVMPIYNADTIIWELLPPEAGSISGSGDSIYVDFDPDFFGEAYITGYGINDCGAGDDATYLTYVIGEPMAEAGLSSVMCQNTPHTLSGTAYNYSVSVWHTEGDGSFDDPFMLDATYTPGPEDIDNGDVYLTLYTVAIPPCSGVDNDNMQLVIKPVPVKPQKPIGPTSIILVQNLSSEYFTHPSENSNSYSWYLTPIEAGTITGIDTSATVFWNQYYPGTTAFVSVEAINDCAAVTSDTLIIDINPVGIEENMTPEVSISPNPSTGIVNISITGILKDLDVHVLSSMGNVIHKKKVNKNNPDFSFQLDLSHQAPGTYHLIFSWDDQLLVESFIIDSK